MADNHCFFLVSLVVIIFIKSKKKHILPTQLWTVMGFNFIDGKGIKL